MQVVEHDIRLTASDGFPFRAFGARPDGPVIGGVVVLHEIFGITEYIKDVVRFLAQQGFHAVAPSLFDRQNHLAGFGIDDPEEGRALAAGADLNAVIADIRAARDLVGMRDGAAVVGFCWGGGLSYLAAAQVDFVAGVGFYPTRVTEYFGQSPKCPLQFHVSETDKWTPPDVREQITQRAPGAEIFVYGADHGFDNNTRPVHDPAASETARERMLTFVRGCFGITGTWRTFERDVAFLGFGELSRAFVDGWSAERRRTVSAYDILFDGRGGDVRAACEQRDVHMVARADAAPEEASVVMSAVTADQAMAAAQSVASVVTDANLYLDLNSVAPATKRAAAEIVGASGGRYVDVAVMAPVARRLHKTPLLLSGPDAGTAAELLKSWGMDAEVVSDVVGDAATVKMVRSVFVKGFESVVTECAVAAERAGVFEPVFSSLGNLRLGADMRGVAGYLMSRVVEHGERRAAEMREVVSTLDELGVTAFTPKATADHQQCIADLSAKSPIPLSEDPQELARSVIDRLRSR